MPTLSSAFLGYILVLRRNTSCAHVKNGRKVIYMDVALFENGPFYSDQRKSMSCPNQLPTECITDDECTTYCMNTRACSFQIHNFSSSELPLNQTGIC